MKAAKRLLYILLPIIIGTGTAFAQGDRCSSIQPFCAGDEQLIFENSSAAAGSMISAELGPSYGCLATQPYPAWFYLQVRETGNLEFMIRQSQNPDGSGQTYDVDFIVWGPFFGEDDFCNELSVANTVDCSYSPSAVEQMRIPNAEADELYVVLITNFSGSPGYISLQQTNTAAGGSTDCSIVENTLGPDRQVCGDEPQVLDAYNPQATNYEWYVLDDNTGEYELLPEETEETLTVTQTGNYRVLIISELLEAEVSDDVLIEFFEIPVAQQGTSVVGCRRGEEALYDLTDATSSLTGNNSGSFSARFYLSQADYENSNMIPDATTFAGNEQTTVLGTIVNDETGCESLPVEIELEIFGMPEVEFPEITAFCIDLRANVVGTVSLGEDLGPGYSYRWNIPNDRDGDGFEEPVLVLESFPSQNPLTLTVTHNETGCESTYSTEVQVFAPPREVTVEVAGSDFEGGYEITVNAERAFGEETTYDYRLNDGPWQESPIFTGVPGGTHTVTAREMNGCGTNTSRPFRLIGYPRFFTPNGDGYNDTWNIINEQQGAVEKVVIFDRFGKLLKEIDPASGGWDGNFNGRPQPADDYWFTVEYREEGTGDLKVFKGHFSLLR